MRPLARHTNALHAEFVPVGDIWFGVRQVTQTEWQTVMGENPSRFHEGFEAPFRPVERITHADALAFCESYTAHLGEGVYRLPTETEWQAAAACGTTTRWHFGEADRDLDAHGWHAGNAGARTRPCGTKQANPAGLHDIYGNVSEWTSTPGDGDRMVHRGGGWFHEADSCTSFNRLTSAKASDAIGLRLVWEGPT